MASSNFQNFLLRAEKAEKEIELLTCQVQDLQNGTYTNSEEEKVPEELEKLRTENAKLKYRIGILQKATQLEAKKGKSVWRMCSTYTVGIWIAN